MVMQDRDGKVLPGAGVVEIAAIRSLSDVLEGMSIDDMTNVYLQQMQGIGLSIHLNELLYYSMTHYMACVSWR